MGSARQRNPTGAEFQYEQSSSQGKFPAEPEFQAGQSSNRGRVMAEVKVPAGQSSNPAPPGTLPHLELCPSWNFAPPGTLPHLELYPSWIYFSCRTHLLGIIRKKIRSLLFSHHLDENIELNLNGGIPALTRTLRRHLFDDIMEMLEFIFCQFLLGISLIYLVR